MKQIFGLGKVDKGILTLKNRQIFKEELKGLSGDVVVTVSEGRGKRSSRQNAYLWSVVYKLIAQHMTELTGEIYEEEDIHQYYKEKFLSKKKHLVMVGEECDIEVGSTAKLNTKDFEEYAENIRRHASTVLSLDVPLPNEPERVKDMLDEYLDLQQQ
jgi:hypothetical protein